MTISQTKQPPKENNNNSSNNNTDDFDTCQYTGDTYDTLRHGHGTLTWPNGDTYTGQFHKGLRHGRGIFISYLPSSSRRRTKDSSRQFIKYEGDWRHSEMNGRGIMTHHSSGDRYEGSFSDGMKNGCGIFKSSQGWQYAGEFQNDRRHGVGFLSRRNKAGDDESYEGYFSNGLFSGWGEYRYADGSRYEGTWMNGLRDGSGLFLYVTGEEYEGEWRRGERHGQGIYRWVNGATRRGEWREGVLKRWLEGKREMGTSERFEREGKPREFDEKIKVMKEVMELKDTTVHKMAFQFKKRKEGLV